MTTLLDETIAAVGYAKVLVVLRPGLAAAKEKAEVIEARLENHFTRPDMPQLLSLAATAVRAASKRIKDRHELLQKRVRVYPNLGLAIGLVDRAGAASLAADAQVDKVVEAPELSLIRPTEAKSAKPTVAPTWGITRLRVPELWAQGIKGKGVVVGHLDTGVDGKHQALKNAIAAFAEFDMAGEQVAGAKPTDSGAHGTHTAGTIVGRPKPKGAFGVAPEAKLASAMVIENGQVIDRVVAGMDWAIGQKVRILSMSLGLRGFTPAFQAITDALRRNNVLPVFAAGNEGPQTSRSPGNYDNVLSVGAIGEDDGVADFSSSQAFDRANDPLVPDLAAPGVDVLSCVPDNAYEKMSGSSMATPHIAGLAALLLQAKPDASAVNLEQAILGSCRLPSGMLRDRANRGVPDAVVALAILTGAQQALVA